MDLPRLRELIESSFSRRLHANYFDKVDLLRLYLTPSYRAAAVVTKSMPVPYLDKLAVRAEAQGEGLSSLLWGKLRLEHPELCWRARGENPINGFYARQASGFVRRSQWSVYWYGLTDLARVQHCVDAAAVMPPDLEERR